MKLYGIDFTEQMRPIVAAGARYKLAVISSHGAVGENALNVGKEMAKAIEGLIKQYGKKGESMFQMEVAETLERIVMENVSMDEEFGAFVILGNLGILFEPELGIDVVGFLRKISKTILTILLWPGEIGEDRLFFLDRKSEITLEQSDINYIMI